MRISELDEIPVRRAGATSARRTPDLRASGTGLARLAVLRRRSPMKLDFKVSPERPPATAGTSSCAGGSRTCASHTHIAGADQEGRVNAVLAHAIAHCLQPGTRSRVSRLQATQPPPPKAGEGRPAGFSAFSTRTTHRWPWTTFRVRPSIPDPASAGDVCRSGPRISGEAGTWVRRRGVQAEETGATGCAETSAVV